MYKCFACMCTCAPCVCLAPGSSARAAGALECWAISPTEASSVHWFPLPIWVRQTQILCRSPRPLDCICGSSGMDYDGEEVQSHEEWTNWCDVGRRIAKRRIEKSEAGRQDTRLCSGPLLPSGNGRAYHIIASTILGVLQRLSERLWQEGVRKWWSNQGWDPWIPGNGSNWDLTFWVLRDRIWFKSIWSESSSTLCLETEASLWHQWQLTAVLIQTGSQLSWKPWYLCGPWCWWSILADRSLSDIPSLLSGSTSTQVFCLRVTEN